jgi:hypothetical protein
MRMTFSTFVTPTRDSETCTVGADACTSGNRDADVGFIATAGYRDTKWR